MPMIRSLYPPDWEQIALQVKEAANWTCMACGQPCLKPGQVTSEWIAANRSRWASLTLTVAHLNHQPEDCRPENLRALCAPCHCRYDLSQMALKKMLKLEREGQLNLFGVSINNSVDLGNTAVSDNGDDSISKTQSF